MVANQTLTGSYGNISDDVTYIQNGSNIDIYEYNGSSWVDSGHSIANKTLSVAKGGIVVTDGLEIYDCTSLPCSLKATITQPVVGVDTPPADPNPQFENWGAAVATDGTKIVVTDDMYDTDSGGTGVDNGIAYIFDTNANIDGYAYLGSSGLQFGSSADIYGDQIIIGAKYEVSPSWQGGTGGGGAHIFKYVGGTWTLQDDIYASDECTAQSSGCLFGNDVGIYENYVIVGHPYIDGEHLGESVYGSGIYLFEKTSGTPDSWNEIIKYRFDEDQGFGEEVAITGNYYYAVGGPDPSTNGSIVITNNKNGSSGSGGGSAVPEFSDYVLILSVAIIVAFMFKTVPKIGKTHIGRA